MNDIEDQFNDMRPVSPSDHYIDWATWKAIVDWFKSRGFGQSITPDLFGMLDTIPDQIFARIGARVRTQNATGDIPDETPVFMFEGTQVHWDSATLAWIDTDGGLLWNGGVAGSAFDQNLLRLIGQPGFGDKVYEYGPLSEGAIVPVYRVNEDALYTAASENGSEITLDEYSWYFSYLGEDPVVHPFKATRDPDTKTTIVVGAMRGFDGNTGAGADVATASHTGPDLFTFMNGTVATVIEKTALETLAIVAAAGTNVYVYYEIDTTSSVPTATLKESEPWPPTTPSDFTNIILIPVAYVRMANPGGGNEINSIGQLLFDNVTFSATGGSTGVKNSVVITGGKINLLGDVPIGGLGDDGAGYFGGYDLAGVSRDFKEIYNALKLLTVMLNPQDDGDLAKTGSNERHIGMTNVNDRQSLNIRHRNIAESDLSARVIGSIYGVNAAGFAALATPATVVTKADLTLYDIDDNHHLFENGVSYTEDPYDPYVDNGMAFNAFSGRATSGTLFNDTITQELQTVDAAGANVTIFDTPINQFIYTAANTAGDTLQINTDILNATKTSVLKDIDEYDAAPKNGNDDDLRLNLARFGFNTQIILKGKFSKTPFSSVFITMDGENGMTMTVAMSADPTDSVSFNTVCTLLKNAGAYGRLDALGEYRIRFEFNYANGDPVDVGGSGTGNFILFITDTDAGWVTNVITLAATPTIPGTRIGDEVTVCCTLEWYQNANALAGMFGDTNYPVECDTRDVGGTSLYTQDIQAGSIDTVIIQSSSDSDGNGNLDLPVPFEYEILKSAVATSDFSDGLGTVSVLKFYNEGDLATPLTVKVGEGSPVTANSFNIDVLDDGAPSEPTDGFTFKLFGFDSPGDLIDGDTYRAVITTPGFTDTVFAGIELTSALATFCWSTFFGSNANDTPQQWPDNFSGAGQNSGAVGDTEWDKRWVLRTAAANASVSISGGALDGVSTNTSTQLEWEINYGSLSTSDFEIEVDVSTYLGGNSTSTVTFSWSTLSGGSWIRVDGATDAIDSRINGSILSSGLTSFAGGVFKISRSSGSVTYSLNGTPFRGPTASSDIADGFVISFRDSSWSIDDISVEATDKDGSLVDYYGTNTIRQAESLTGEAYQLVTGNQLQQIVASDTIREYVLQLTPSSGSTLNIKYFDDSSTVKIRGIDGISTLFTATPASVDTLILERGPFSNSDTFDGTGQNSVSETGGVFESRWDIVGPGTVAINSNACDVSQTNSAPDETGIHQTFDADLPDGFVIKSNWSSLSLSSTTTGYRSWTLRIGNVSSGRFVQIYRSRDSGDNTDDLYANSTSEGANLIEANSSTSGEFKIIQSGNDFLLYLDDVLKDTVTDATLASQGIDNFRFEMQLGGNSGTSSATIDDVTIETAASTERFEDRVLYKDRQGTTDKLYYALSGVTNDVESIDIVTDAGANMAEIENLFDAGVPGNINSETWRFEAKLASHNIDGSGDLKTVTDEEVIESPEGTEYCTNLT